MNGVSGRLRLVYGCVGLLATTAMAQQMPTMSLKAVKINGVTIVDQQGDPAPTNVVSVSPGDEIEANIFAREWSPNGEGLRAFQAFIPRSSFITGTRGTALPLGWDRPASQEDDVPCTMDADCPADFPVCDEAVDRCVGPNFDPTLGLFMDESRLDWVFRCPAAGGPCASFGGVATGDIKYAKALFNPAESPVFAEPSKYCGTMILVLSDDACGTFTFPIDPNPTDSFLIDQNTFFIEPLERQGLTMIVTSPGFPPGTGQCDCRNIVASDPPNCTIDARQPTDPDGTNPQGLNSITLTFDCNNTVMITDADFAPTVVPGGAVPPVVDTLTPDPVDGSKLTVTLVGAGAFGTKKWTCIRFLPGEAGTDQVCLGILPGDVDESSTSDETDVLAMIDCLTTPGSCTDFQCDADRSGGCTGADILRLIDLLNGAAFFDAWFDQAIEPIFGGDPIACPSAPVPSSLNSARVNPKQSRRTVSGRTRF